MVASKSDKERVTLAISKLTKNLTEFSELLLDVMGQIEQAPTTAESSNTASKSRKKKEVDPNAPKRNLTSYFLYSQSVRADVVAKNPGLKTTEIAKLIGEKWKSLSDKEKQPFVKQALKEKAKYDKESKKYKASLADKSSSADEETKSASSSTSSEEESEKEVPIKKESGKKESSKRKSGNNAPTPSESASTKKASKKAKKASSDSKKKSSKK